MPDDAQFTILIPIYNDWDSLRLFLKEIEGALAANKLSAEVMIINDGSTTAHPFTEEQASAFHSFEIVHLRRNLGHQRAITTGLTYIFARNNSKPVLVVDGDGEDRAEDIPRLWRKFQQSEPGKIVFAERTRRSEGLLFTTLYKTYQGLHLLLTGLPVKIGNFSLIPFERLSNLLVISEMWNHYGAAVLKSKIPFDTVPTSRGKRLLGKSKLGWVGLFVHGLSALAVFGEIVGTRLLLLTIALFLASTVALLGLFAGASLLNLSFSMSLSIGLGLVLLLLSQTLIMAAGLVLFVLNTRNGMNFLPIRDCEHFIGHVERIAGPAL
jgi:polyisoprenyl-phosphate glycosyltransferase